MENGKKKKLIELVFKNKNKISKLRLNDNQNIISMSYIVLSKFN